MIEKQHTQKESIIGVESIVMINRATASCHCTAGTPAPAL